MKLFEFFSHCPLVDYLFEGPKAKKDDGIADILSYGNWTIKALKRPDSKGEFAAMGYHDRNPNTARMTGSSQEEAIKNVKTAIDRYVSIDQSVIRASRITIDYNVEFTTDVLNELGGPTGVRFEKRGGDAILVVASVEYLELGDEVFGTGPDQFSRLFKRIPAGNEQSKASMVYCSPMSGSFANKLGLVGSGRYTIEYVGSDEYKNQMFKLVFDSIVSSKEDKRRLRKPGLTVAVS
jgi:hypothetical protein